MYEFWYDYVKPKYGEKQNGEIWWNTKLCYVDTGSFIVHVKTEDVHKDIEESIETRFDTANFELCRPFPKKKR